VCHRQPIPAPYPDRLLGNFAQRDGMCKSTKGYVQKGTGDLRQAARYFAQTDGCVAAD